MTNVIVYSVNGNQQYVDMMVNSINSCNRNSPLAIDCAKILILTDCQLDLSKIDPNVDYDLVKTLTYDYSKLNGRYSRLTQYAYYRWEMFVNPVFKDVDNLLYIDVDTEIKSDISGIFIDNAPGIYLAEEHGTNWLSHQGFSSERYFNSGVILFTPKKIKDETKNDFFNDLIDVARTHKFMFVDQCALNFVISQQKYKWMLKELNCRYNYLQSTSNGVNENEAKIRHYPGVKKTYDLLYL